MTLLVPFDGSELSRAALVRAREFGAVFEYPVFAVSIVPQENTRYARERGWIDEIEQFDLRTVISRLQASVTDTCPGATFKHVTVDRYASPGVISKRLRKVAKSENAVMVFIGSENAGRIVAGLSSAGAGVATDTGYDVVIVRHTDPTNIGALSSDT